MRRQHELWLWAKQQLRITRGDYKCDHNNFKNVQELRMVWTVWAPKRLKSGYPSILDSQFQLLRDELPWFNSNICVMHRMNALPGDLTNIHAIVLHHIAPVPTIEEERSKGQRIGWWIPRTTWGPSPLTPLKWTRRYSGLHFGGSHPRWPTFSPSQDLRTHLSLGSRPLLQLRRKKFSFSAFSRLDLNPIRFATSSESIVCRRVCHTSGIPSSCQPVSEKCPILLYHCNSDLSLDVCGQNFSPSTRPTTQWRSYWRNWFEFDGTQRGAEDWRRQSSPSRAWPELAILRCRRCWPAVRAVNWNYVLSKSVWCKQLHPQACCLVFLMLHVTSIKKIDFQLREIDTSERLPLFAMRVASAKRTGQSAAVTLAVVTLWSATQSQSGSGIGARHLFVHAMWRSTAFMYN